MKRSSLIIKTLLMVLPLMLMEPAIFGTEPSDFNVFTIHIQKNDSVVNVEQKKIAVQFINQNNETLTRYVSLFIPEGSSVPRPLIFVPHYEVTKESPDLSLYLAEGWCVASPADFKGEYNAQLTSDNLIFNSAALYTLRNLDEVDTERIALVGGSAGGYTALMLSALHLGICSTIANSPITNIYFNFYQYFPETKKFNIPENKKDSPEGQKVVERLGALGPILGKYPMPILAAIIDSFIPIVDSFPNPDDTARWEAFSPVGLADCFSSPVAATHFTSDVLVPVDQISKSFTYSQEGTTMPDGLCTRLPEGNPGVLGRSFEEVLPKDRTSVRLVKLSEIDGDKETTFDPEKQFVLNIIDDGPTEGYGGHRASEKNGTMNQIRFLKDNFSKTCAQTETVTSGKLVMLLKRYLGLSVQTPPHYGVDDDVYGSLAIYRKEVVAELAQWTQNHSLDELDALMSDAIATIDDSEQSRYASAWESIKRNLGF